MDVNALKNSEAAKKFAAGEVIASENDTDIANEEMYIVLEGHVGMYKNYKKPGELKIKNLGAGKIFGEMSLFLHKERMETAVAIDDVVLYVVGRATAFDFFQTQPQLTGFLIKKLCQELDDASKTLRRVLATNKKPEAAPAPAPAMPSAPISDTPPPGFISDKPPAGFISDTPPAGFISDTPPPGFISDSPPAGPGAPASLPSELFPEGHEVYDFETPPPSSTDLVYKKNFKCPVCEKSFPAYAVRTTRLKLEQRDKDFRSRYQSIDTTYYEIVTCPDCWFSNFDSAYTQPIIARFKENIPQITAYKAQIGMDLVEDRSMNAVFAGYYLALKGAPLFYKNPEMFVAKMWLRLKWLYSDVNAPDMEAMAAKKAHESYLSAFEKTDASPEAIQQLCVLMGELSLIVKDIANAKTFFVKARGYRGGSKALLSQAEDGIEVIRRVESGQLQL
jgi:uncharacterized protein (DUF2225 family)